MTRVRRVFLECENYLKQQNILRAARARGLRDNFENECMYSRFFYENREYGHEFSVFFYCAESGFNAWYNASPFTVSRYRWRGWLGRSGYLRHTNLSRNAGSRWYTVKFIRSLSNLSSIICFMLNSSYPMTRTSLMILLLLV